MSLLGGGRGGLWVVSAEPGVTRDTRCSGDRYATQGEEDSR